MQQAPTTQHHCVDQLLTFPGVVSCLELLGQGLLARQSREA